MDFGNIFNQAYSIDAGSSNLVLASRNGVALQREPCLISLVPRKPPPDPLARFGAPPPEPTLRLHGVGSDAAAAVPVGDNTVRLIHPIERSRIVDVGALELVLRKLMRRVPVNALRRLLFGVRMTLLAPLHLQEAERLRYQELLRDFGFARLHMLEGALAAAHGAGLDVEQSRGQMLVDVGGGQTTVAVFTLGSIAAWHWRPIGGRDLDAAVWDFLCRRFRINLHPALAEHVKVALGSVYPRARPETLDIVGKDPETGVEKKVTVDDNELRDVLIDACEPLVMAVHQGFDEVAPELAADIAQGEITLVGGGALLTGLPQFFAERTGLNFRLAADPINAAMRGALTMA